MTIQAIETRYAGCRFRSRLEARWAVLFDHLGLSWDYEPQGYVINGRPYLPDFHVDRVGWIEIKGDHGDLDVDLMYQFSTEVGHRVVVLGPMPQVPIGGDWTWRSIDTFPNGPDPEDGMITDDSIRIGFGSFPWKDRLWLHYEDVPGRDDGLWLTPAFTWDGDGAAAYAAARSARFEHGERGAS